MKDNADEALIEGLMNAIEDDRDGDFCVVAARVAYAKLIKAEVLEVTLVQRERLSTALIGSGLRQIARDLLST